MRNSRAYSPALLEWQQARIILNSAPTSRPAARHACATSSSMSTGGSPKRWKLRGSCERLGSYTRMGAFVRCLVNMDDTNPSSVCNSTHKDIPGESHELGKERSLCSFDDSAGWLQSLANVCPSTDTCPCAKMPSSKPRTMCLIQGKKK